VSQLQQYYARYWTDGEGWTPEVTLHPAFAACFRRYLTPRTVLLDVGCGDGGHYGATVAKEVKTYHGLDVSPEAVRKARAGGLDAEVHDLSTPLPFAAATFDVVLCIEVLEHLFDPAFVVAESHRVLIPGGHLIVSVPNAAYLGERLLLLLRGEVNPKGSPDTASEAPWIDPHIRFFTRRTIRKLLTEKGFVVREFIGVGCELLARLPFFPFTLGYFDLWRRASRPLEFLARLRPSLFALQFLVVAERPR